MMLATSESPFFFRPLYFFWRFLSLQIATKAPWLWFASSYWPLEALRNSCCIALEFAPVPWNSPRFQAALHPFPGPESLGSGVGSIPMDLVESTGRFLRLKKRWRFHESTRYGSFFFFFEERMRLKTTSLGICWAVRRLVLQYWIRTVFGLLDGNLMDVLTLMIGNPPRKSSYRLEVNKVNNGLYKLFIFDYISHNQNYDFSTVVQIHIQT